VTLDNYRAGHEATEHLLGHRHSHIIAISAPYKLHPLRSRLKGYNEAMSESGKVAETIVWTGAEQLRSELYQALRRKRGSATAILSMSYSVTIPILSALRDSQISLRDVGFIGIDDMEFASFLGPPLTTIAQPAEEFVRLSVTTAIAPYHTRSTACRTRDITRKHDASSLVDASYLRRKR
jgi:LacI family repressor for deo operon, udp, cdd, tsx, nupC, and nupG